MRYNNTILKPLISEKSVKAAEEGEYTFKVNMKASKGAVQNKLKEMFNVDAIRVRSMIVPGKPKRIIGTRRFTKTPKWKKVIVQLKEGQQIDIFPKE
jgi:large subunit ribosomal protein L23